MPRGYEPLEVLLLHPAVVYISIKIEIARINWYLITTVEVAQLVRASVSYALGREFKSHPRHKKGIHTWLVISPVTLYNAGMAPMYRDVNRDFFKKWTPGMAYVLGFFAADGYMWVTKRGGKFFGFQINDKKLLYSIRDTLESDHKIAIRKRRNPKWSETYRLQIGSNMMFEDLLRLGMTIIKTKSIEFPKIPQKYFGDFVRGYFDGDGNVWVGEIHKERKTTHISIQSVFTCSIKHFLITLKEELAKYNLKGGSLVTRGGRHFNLQYSINDSIMLYHLMYDQCTSDLFLERKKKKFEKYIKQTGS